MPKVMRSLKTKKLCNFTRFPTVTPAFTLMVLDGPATIPGLFAAISCLRSETDDPDANIIIPRFFRKYFLLPLLFYYLLLLLLLVLHAFSGGMSVALSRHPVGVSLSLKTIACAMAPPPRLPQLKQRGDSRWS